MLFFLERYLSITMVGSHQYSYSFQKKEISPILSVVLRIKGDGKKYQFRIKEKRPMTIRISVLFKPLPIGKQLRSNE